MGKPMTARRVACQFVAHAGPKADIGDMIGIQWSSKAPRRNILPQRKDPICTMPQTISQIPHCFIYRGETRADKVRSGCEMHARSLPH
jgi:hypothetical protein